MISTNCFCLVASSELHIESMDGFSFVDSFCILQRSYYAIMFHPFMRIGRSIKEMKNTEYILGFMNSMAFILLVLEGDSLNRSKTRGISTFLF
jgi:hypothetical protein